nr:MAG TPA: minor tail protein L [Caudoviricetes sp.]
MPRTQAIKIYQAASALQQNALVDLWELDLRPLGGEILRYCNIVNELGQPVVWKGKTYDPHPIHADGFEMTGQGAGNRPKVTLANVLGVITGLAEKYDQLVGAEVWRRQTYSQFLDAVNFAGGNPEADPTQEIVSKYLIERMVTLTTENAQFELSAPSEADGSIIPARLMLSDHCPWVYRGEECGYRGKPVADRFDMPTNDPQKDDCSHKFLGCKARFGETAALPYGGWISVDKTLT